MRTAINSISFMLSVLTGAIMMNIIAPIYDFSMNNYFLKSFKPFNAFIPYTAIGLIILYSVYSLFK